MVGMGETKFKERRQSRKQMGKKALGIGFSYDTNRKQDDGIRPFLLLGHFAFSFSKRPSK
jgi:hypothetical protein